MVIVVGRKGDYMKIKKQFTLNEDQIRSIFLRALESHLGITQDWGPVTVKFSHTPVMGLSVNDLTAQIEYYVNVMTIDD